MSQTFIFPWNKFFFAGMQVVSAHIISIIIVGNLKIQCFEKSNCHMTAPRPTAQPNHHKILPSERLSLDQPIMAPHREVMIVSHDRAG